ncbi:hypothetical protein M758_12G124500 [Ceratodon purpureus]|uniref:Secreted protein n=1 Tax=Ceratodon purpureus TaxID=3225 RepID=A0A8T0G724_CERPU|nr:hypothetical protein KC19_12G121900 [Ceratodon purpureus]KAG0599060.1 hypothetical protein M758_12G124500 [Ceratodon purpureus]
MQRSMCSWRISFAFCFFLGLNFASSCDFVSFGLVDVFVVGRIQEQDLGGSGEGVYWRRP